MTISKT